MNQQALFHEMYSLYGHSDVVGIAFFERYKEGLVKNSFKDVLAFQMCEYPHQYVLDFILGTPFLWKELTPEDWMSILIMPRNHKMDPEPDGRFSDFEFFSRFLKIDVIRFAMISSLIDAESKISLINYFSRFSYLLASSELDEEDLDGIYQVDKTQIDEAAKRFLGKYACMTLQLDINGARQYIANVRRDFRL